MEQLFFSQQAIQVIKELLAAGIVTVPQLQTAMNGVNNVDGTAFPQYVAYCEANQLRDITRRGRITFVNIRSRTALGMDGFNEVVFSSTPNDNDIFIFRQDKVSQNITIFFSSAVNISGQTTDFRLGGTDTYAAFIYNGKTGKLNKVFGRPQNGEPVETLEFKPETVTIDGDVAAVTSSYIQLQSERSASTPSSATWQVTATGTNGSVSLYFDSGDGDVLLGSASFVGSPSALTVIDDVRDAINALTATHQATAVNDGIDTVTVSFNANLGSAPNGWLFHETLTGGITSVIDAAFAGGVDGSDQNDNLQYLTGLGDGSFGFIENIMPAHSITPIAGGNIDGGDVGRTIPPLEILAFLVVGSTVKLMYCCRPYKATLWVDQLGPANSLRGWFNRPFSTIAAALAAAQLGDEINVMAVGYTGATSNKYDERNLLFLNNLTMNFAGGAKIEYTGAAAGGIWDDSATGSNGAISMVTLNFAKYGDVEAYSIEDYVQNLGSNGGGDVGVFKITDGGSIIFVNGGRFFGKNYTVKVTDGIIEISNAQIWTNSSTSIGVQISNGVCILKNCSIFANTNSIPIDISGGRLVLEDCLIHNFWNNAAGHGIKYTGAAGSGTVVFNGVNRIICSNAGANGINLVANQNCKIQGQVYSTHVIGGGGTLTDLRTTVAVASPQFIQSTTVE